MPSIRALSTLLLATAPLSVVAQQAADQENGANPFFQPPQDPAQPNLGGVKLSPPVAFDPELDSEDYYNEYAAPQQPDDNHADADADAGAGSYDFTFTATPSPIEHANPNPNAYNPTAGLQARDIITVSEPCDTTTTVTTTTTTGTIISTHTVHLLDTAGGAATSGHHQPLPSNLPHVVNGSAIGNATRFPLTNGTVDCGNATTTVLNGTGTGVKNMGKATGVLYGGPSAKPVAGVGEGESEVEIALKTALGAGSGPVGVGGLSVAVVVVSVLVGVVGGLI